MQASVAVLSICNLVRRRTLLAEQKALRHTAELEEAKKQAQHR